MPFIVSFYTATFISKHAWLQCCKQAKPHLQRVKVGVLALVLRLKLVQQSCQLLGLCGEVCVCGGAGGEDRFR